MPSHHSAELAVDHLPRADHLRGLPRLELLLRSLDGPGQVPAHDRRHAVQDPEVLEEVGGEDPGPAAQPAPDGLVPAPHALVLAQPLQRQAEDEEVQRLQTQEDAEHHWQDPHVVSAADLREARLLDRIRPDLLDKLFVAPIVSHSHQGCDEDAGSVEVQARKETLDHADQEPGDEPQPGPNAAKGRAVHDQGAQEPPERFDLAVDRVSQDD
mmetsp:Transcript_66125/g.196804  ORF Transcript_66125/g.196804 Transcript_66125/m.196804 type:complete len:212 (+) Transcript_66125:547-1182(+)